MNRFWTVKDDVKILFLLRHSNCSIQCYWFWLYKDKNTLWIAVEIVDQLCVRSIYKNRWDTNKYFFFSVPLEFFKIVFWITWKMFPVIFFFFCQMRWMCLLGCSLFASGLINSPYGQLWSLFRVLLTFCDPFFKVGGCRNTSLLTRMWNTCSSSHFFQP